MLAFQERVTQQFALGGNNQSSALPQQPSISTQPQLNSPSADAARMWQTLLLGAGGSVGYSSAPQSGRPTSNTTPATTLPNGSTTTAGSSLLDLSSVLELSTTLHAASSLLGGSNNLGATGVLGGFQAGQFGQASQHPLYQHGLCVWPQCNQVNIKKGF